MKLPDCTIIIPTRNRGAELAITVDLLCRQDLADTPVIVIDDASDDPEETRAPLAKLSDARFIGQETRTGQAAARNVGLETAHTRYCLFMDDDSHLEDAAPLVAFLQQLEPSETAVWRFETIREADGYRDGIPASMPATSLYTFIGFGVLMDREKVLAAGGYRPYFCYRHEEDDLAIRVFRSGCRIQYQPGVRFIHRHTPLARSSREYNQLSARNIFLLYAMNWPLPLGPLYGFAKAVSLILKTRDDLWARVQGLCSGVSTAMRNRHDRTALSWSQLRAYRRLCQDVEDLKKSC